MEVGESVDKYKVVKVLSEGEKEDIYLAIDEKSFPCLVVYVRRIHIYDEDSEKLELEIENDFMKVVMKICCPFLVQYKGTFIINELSRVFAMDYHENWNLEKEINLKKENKEMFPEDRILEIFGQLTVAIYTLHENGIIHRQITPEQVFMVGKNVKLGGFGSSKMFERSMRYSKAFHGKLPSCIAPEVLLRNGNNGSDSTHSDLYSLGAVMYEVCELRSIPVNGIFGEFKPIPQIENKKVNLAVKDLILGLVSLSPTDRFKIEDVVQCPPIREYIKSLPAEYLPFGLQSLCKAGGSSDCIYYVKEEQASDENPLAILPPNPY